MTSRLPSRPQLAVLGFAGALIVLGGYSALFPWWTRRVGLEHGAVEYLPWVKDVGQPIANAVALFVALIGASIGWLVLYNSRTFCQTPSAGAAPQSPAAISGRAFTGIKLAVVWVLSVALFAGYGSFKSREGSSWIDVGVAEGAIRSAGIGFSIVTCLVPGIHLVGRIRRKTLSKWWALAFLAGASVVAAFAPPLFMAFVSACTNLYSGDASVQMVYWALYTFWIGLIGFLVCTAWILLTRTNQN